ncbi:MAG: hypothetical protein HWD59_02145 [Coxiellaceae bacterium]|nr:MAG: hypothetical protein HWD59_02145 [Coxiellaceae bacterium]
MLLLVSGFTEASSYINISSKEALQIGVKIWYNESGGTVNGLTAWNEGEDFASMGIGHFIWYPRNHAQTFSESFPALIKYMEARGVVVPYWLQGDQVPDCPWRNRAEFMRAFHTQRMTELRQFLLDTIPWQAEFMVYRMENALPRMLASVPPEERSYIRQQFYRIATHPQGIYALVDYVNFKGIGASPYHDYQTQSQGWGLLQVLEQMQYAPEYFTTLQAFAWAADQVLTQRVVNNTTERDESQWLAGWRNRLRTYLD